MVPDGIALQRKLIWAQERRRREEKTLSHPASLTIKEMSKELIKKK
jgi:hypothetical protein